MFGYSFEQLAVCFGFWAVVYVLLRPLVKRFID